MVTGLKWKKNLDNNRLFTWMKQAERAELQTEKQQKLTQHTNEQPYPQVFYTKEEIFSNQLKKRALVRVEVRIHRTHLALEAGGTAATHEADFLSW